MGKTLKRFQSSVIHGAVVRDMDGHWRIAKTAVDESNNLCISYYLPKTKNDKRIIELTRNSGIPVNQINVYE